MEAISVRVGDPLLVTQQRPESLRWFRRLRGLSNAVLRHIPKWFVETSAFVQIQRRRRVSMNWRGTLIHERKPAILRTDH